MKTQQIAITLEHRAQEQLTQEPDDTGKLRTSVIKKPALYRIKAMKNAVTIDWAPATKTGPRVLRIGTDLCEEDADYLARDRAFQVTVTD